MSGGEKCHAITVLHHGAGFGDGYRNIAVEGERGTGGDARMRGIEIELAEFERGAGGKQGFEGLPRVEIRFG